MNTKKCDDTNKVKEIYISINSLFEVLKVFQIFGFNQFLLCTLKSYVHLNIGSIKCKILIVLELQF